LFNHISSNRGVGEYNFVFLVKEVARWNGTQKQSDYKTVY
jgi:hypothetical protein